MRRAHASLPRATLPRTPRSAARRQFLYKTMDDAYNEIFAEGEREVNPASDKRPLYAQVYAELVERIRSGRWKAGQLIPNEFEIAAEFRSARARPARPSARWPARTWWCGGRARHVRVRAHPRRHHVSLLQSLRRSGERIIPAAAARMHPGKANQAERKALQLPRNARVIRIDRLRTRDRKPFITESIALPEAAFPGLADRTEIPDTFYDVFQKIYGVLVTRTEERLTPRLPMPRPPGARRCRGTPCCGSSASPSPSTTGPSNGASACATCKRRSLSGPHAGEAAARFVPQQSRV